MSAAGPDTVSAEAGDGNQATRAGGRPALDENSGGGRIGSHDGGVCSGHRRFEGTCVNGRNKPGHDDPEATSRHDDAEATPRHATNSLARGWCPGVLQPMPSGDGLIVRLKLSLGSLDVALAEQIARWSRRWGNGQIDLSSRANLQLRGLSERHLPDLHEALAGFGLLEGNTAGEAVRNVICSPLAGLDPAAVLDIRPVAESLERRLANDAVLHALPGKFGFAVDDGGWLGLGGVPADIQFVACYTGDGPAFTVHLAGDAQDGLGPCRPDAVSDVAAALGRVFVRLRGTQVHRMRDLVTALGAEVIAREAGLVHARLRPPARAALPSTLLGAHALGAGGFLGVGLAFGRVAAEHLAELVSAAAAVGGGELRLTPWRAILVPVPSVAAARLLSARLEAGRNERGSRRRRSLSSLHGEKRRDDLIQGAASDCFVAIAPRNDKLAPVSGQPEAPHSFILDPEDPRRRIAACPGAPSCERATTPVRDDAARLVPGLATAPGSNILIHVSGCEKGCAHPRVAPVTLVGRNGRYDLVRDGMASGSPALCDLTFEQAVDQVRGGSA
jgi:precorrin-3B synthase